ncbi:serine/threonine-protein kinase [Dactylosporangium sp. CS-047395]|uniref:serine/threonine-protein kinase n=1 Tax=Dactylosporangium sp. CS-047395 TaxID=3239936 RepID=UPI003D93C5AB
MDAGHLINGRYLLAEQLGEGGMSVVWRAHDRVLGREVAVKVLNSRLAEDADWRRRIRLEARSAARLSHPNITNVYDYGETSDHIPFVVMELLRGPTLGEQLRGGPLKPAAAVRICAEVAAGLAAAHAEGLVHRDVKPANVMLTPDAAKVLDFGIVGIVGIPDEDDTDQVLGTPAYLAPERLLSGSVTPASDVYAFGLLLYRCLTGQLPWSGETTTQMVTAHVTVAPAPLPEIDGLSPDVRELCMQCLAKEPDDRPAAVVVAARLAGAAGIVPRFSVVLQEPDPGDPRPEPSTQLVDLPLLPGIARDETGTVETAGDRRRVLLGLGALVAIAGLVTAAVLTTGDPAPRTTAEAAAPVSAAPSSAPPAADASPAPSQQAVTTTTAPATTTAPPASSTATLVGDTQPGPGGGPAPGPPGPGVGVGVNLPTGGGVIVAICAGKKVNVQRVLPGPGIEVVRADLGERGGNARVELRKGDQRLRYDVSCPGGGPPVVTQH